MHIQHNLAIPCDQCNVSTKILALVAKWQVMILIEDEFEVDVADNHTVHTNVAYNISHQKGLTLTFYNLVLVD